MTEDEHTAWREQQRRAVQAHAAAEDRRRADEQAQAAELVAWFVDEATRAGLRPRRLTALAHHGRGRYRTSLTGWYVDRALSRAVGVDGRFYLLTVRADLRSRLLGAAPQPHPAPLVVGAGGRDGESIPLRTLLTSRLAAGDNWP